MSFNLWELSLFKGRPQRLYRFSVGALVLGFTSHERTVRYNHINYQSAQITDDGIRQKGEAASDQLKISVPAGFEAARLFLAGRPSMTVTLFDKHADSDEGRMVWMGEVEEINQPNGASIEIYCRPSGTRAMTGLALSWSRECPYTLYDKNCKVAEENFKAAFNVQQINGRTLIADGALDAFADGWFSGGFIQWTNADGLVFTRGIHKHQGDTLHLINHAPLAFGQPCTAFAGCNQLIKTCHEKFDNLDNCGAFPHMPGKSPFDGDPIF